MNNLKSIEKHLKKKYEIRYNLILNRVFYKLKNCKSCPLSILDEYELNSIHRDLTNKNFGIGKRALRDLLRSDFIEKYDPIKDFYDSLGSYDTKSDPINELASTVKTTDDEMFRWAFKKWFVALIACSIDEKVTNHCALIFIGEQSIGKTTWIERLLPDEICPYMYSGRINPTNKDSILQLSECVLINMEEIGSFNKSQTEAFKEIITKSVIRERRSYGVFAENFIRRASFIGSSNNHNILIDVTGNRRFLVFEALNFLNSIKVDFNKVYAQGYSLYKSGFKYWFDKKDIEKINTHNEQYRQIDLEEEFLLKYFNQATKEDEDVIFKSASEVIDFISNKERGNASRFLKPIEMGKILKAKGFKETKIKGSKKYILKLKTE